MINLEEILGKLNDAKSARQGAMAKIRSGMEELLAADAQMDSAMAALDPSNQDWWNEHGEAGYGGLEDIFGLYKLGAKSFGFGDLL